MQRGEYGTILTRNLYTMSPSGLTERKVERNNSQGDLDVDHALLCTVAQLGLDG